jgi:CO dehydrogenase maturation factor
MSYIIAVAGKGGTGKTTIAGSLVRYIKDKKLGTVLAIDADPNSNLGEFLGVNVKEDIGSIIEDIAKNPDQIPKGTPKDRFIDYRIQTSVVESNGFDLLTMGLPEGPGCCCYANTVLRGIITKLSDDYDFVVIDNEAGMEHLSRRTMRKADYLLLISDHSLVGVRTAKKIFNLIKRLKININSTAIIINRTEGKSRIIKDELSDLKLDLISTLPQDSALSTLSKNNKSIFSLKNCSPFYKSLKNVFKKLGLPAL